MKKIIVACFAVLLFLVPAFIFASSCDSAGEYYVKFTFEGEEYVCSFGHPESDVDVPYAAVTTTPPVPLLVAPDEYIEFFGGSWDPTSPELPNFLIEVGGTLSVFTAGEYTGEYPLPDLFPVWIWIVDGESYYYYIAALGSITIDSFGEIGGAIEGSFNATFTLSGDLVIPAAIGDSPQTVSGSFRVKRIAPEDLPPMIN